MKQYLIRMKDTLRLFYHSTNGWNTSLATVFNEQEKEKFELPEGGEWVCFTASEV